MHFIWYDFIVTNVFKGNVPSKDSSRKSRPARQQWLQLRIRILGSESSRLISRLQFCIQEVVSSLFEQPLEEVGLILLRWLHRLSSFIHALNMLKANLNGVMHPHKVPLLSDELHQVGLRHGQQNFTVWIGNCNLQCNAMLSKSNQTFMIFGCFRRLRVFK